MPNQPQVVKFGVFEVDLQAGEVRKAGMRQKLAGQPFQVLQALLERPQEIVTREELRERLWPGNTFVDYELGLKKAVNRLREVLGDSAESPHFIETIPKRGYRFLGTIEAAKQPSAAPATTPRPTRMKIPGALTVGLALGLIAALLIGLNIDKLRTRIFAKSRSIEIRSIAVLPLQNLSNDPNQDYFSEGITDALTTELAQIGALRVISRTSAEHFKGTRETLPEIGRKLNVEAIVEGSVTRSENRVRITAQLIEAPSDRHLWAKSYERDLKDVLALQDEVARDIAAEIRVKLTPDVQGRLSTSRVVDPEVYDDYLRGRYHWNRRTAEGVNRGIDYFRLAIAKDPRCALAYTGLADSYIVLAGYRVVSPNRVLPLAKAAALKALEIDDSLAEARTPLADLRAGYDFDLAGAEKEFKRAIEVNPNYATAHQWYGEDVLAAMGRFPEALSELRQAEALDPLSRAINTIHGYVLYLARDNDAAIIQLRKAMELDENFPLAHMYLGRVYVQTKMYAEAVSEFKKADDLSGGEVFYRAWLAYGYAVSGQTNPARKILNELKKLSNNGYAPPYDVAAIWMGLGEKEQALKWLETAYEDHAAYIPAINVEPVFEALHSDQRFQDLVRRLNLPVNSTYVDRPKNLSAHSRPGEIRSIAVLPLQNLSNDPNQDYFSDGITDALTTELAQIGALRVISRTSAEHFKGTRETLPEIGRKLNVEAIVEGSVTRSENRVRITAQLIEAVSDHHLWAKSYERDLKDVLALQDEVARDIAEEIRIKLSPEERTRLTNARPINPEAHEAYLRGRFLWNQRTEDQLHKAKQYFEEAIAKEPDYAPAYSGLADTYFYLSYGWGHIPPKEGMPLATAAARKSIELDPSAAEGHASLGTVKMLYDWDFPGAEQEFKRAIALNPNYEVGHHAYSVLLGAEHRYEESVSEARKAVEVDPLSVPANNILSSMLAAANRWDEAFAQDEKALELDPNPTHVIMFRNRIADYYRLKGRTKEAIEEELKARAARGASPQELEEIRTIYARSGRKGVLQREVNLALQRWEKSHWHNDAFVVAQLYAELGDMDNSFKWIDKCVELRSTVLIWIYVGETAWRKDPRFAEVQRKMGVHY